MRALRNRKVADGGVEIHTSSTNDIGVSIVGPSAYISTALNISVPMAASSGFYFLKVACLYV